MFETGSTTLSYCTNCGAGTEPHTKFCGTCGHALEPVAVAVAAEERPAPPAAPVDGPADRPVMPPPPAGAPQAPAVSVSPAVGRLVQTVLVGNWAGAAVVAATAVGVAGFLSTLLGLIAKPGDFGIDNTLTMIAVLMTSTFGGDLTVTSEIPGIHGGGSLGLFPLTITLLTVAATILAYRRVTVRYRSGLTAFADGVRAAFLAAIPFLVVTFLFRSDNDDFGPGALSAFADDDYRVSIGGSHTGAFFMTFLVLVVVLGVATLMRRHWLGERAARVHDWVAAPIAGVSTLAVLLPVAGAIAWFALLLLGDGADTGDLDLDGWMSVIAGAVIYAGNAGLALVTLGAAGKLGASAEGTANAAGQDWSQDQSIAHGLTWFTGEWGEPGLWVAVIVTPLWLAAGAYVAARKAGRIGPGKGIAAYVVSLLVAIPVLVRLAGIHAHGEVKGNLGDLLDASFFGLEDLVQASAHGGASVGPVAISATLLLTLYGAVVGLLVALAAGVVSTGDLKSQASSFAKNIQVPPTDRTE